MRFELTIGLVGEKRAGKETFRTLFLRCLERNIWSPSEKAYVFSDPLTATLKRFGIPNTRPNLQLLASLLRAYYHKEDVITAGMRSMIGEDGHELKFIDGIRWPSDENFIREFPYSFLIYVTASPEVRFKRTQTSANSKEGEQSMSWDQFLATESAPTETNISEIGSRADFKIENNGSLGEYAAQVKNFYDQLVKPQILRLKDKGKAD